MSNKVRIARLEDDVKTHAAALKFLIVALEKTATDWVVKNEMQKVLKGWDEMEKENVEKKDG